MFFHYNETVLFFVSISRLTSYDSSFEVFFHFFMCDWCWNPWDDSFVVIFPPFSVLHFMIWSSCFWLLAITITLPPRRHLAFFTAPKLFSIASDSFMSPFFEFQSILELENSFFFSISANLFSVLFWISLGYKSYTCSLSKMPPKTLPSSWPPLFLSPAPTPPPSLRSRCQPTWTHLDGAWNFSFTDQS